MLLVCARLVEVTGMVQFAEVGGTGSAAGGLFTAILFVGIWVTVWAAIAGLERKSIRVAVASIVTAGAIGAFLLPAVLTTDNAADFDAQAAEQSLQSLFYFWLASV